MRKIANKLADAYNKFQDAKDNVIQHEVDKRMEQKQNNSNDNSGMMFFFLALVGFFIFKKL